MAYRMVLGFMLLLAGTAHAQTAQHGKIKAPVLKNRTEIIAERTRIANLLLKRGDSLLIRVYAYVDERGVTHQPEVKTPSGHAKADSAAMMLVRKMKWQPAVNVRRGVMITIPVKLVRK